MPAIIPRSPQDTWAASAQRRNYTDSRSNAHTSSARDVRDDFPQAVDIHYHIQLPSLSMYSNHNPSRAEHIYPNPSIPSSSHVRQPHDYNVRMPPTVPPGPAMTQGSHHHPSWQHQPYVRVPPLVPPPPVPHKVWILDCKSCSNFLTNRGMKAVLLLRPNVPLYSTDAMPINCSASSANDPPYSSQASSNDIERFHVSTRTCECLTQTLYCHGCGGSVGYMIVSPCHRCTSSITVTNRTTNGHRFVFYSSEIEACERRYVPGENGIRSPVVSLLPVPVVPSTSTPGQGITPSNSGIFASLSSNSSFLDDSSDFESMTSSPPPLQYQNSPNSPSFSDHSYHYSESTPDSTMPDLSPITSQSQSPQIPTHIHREVPTSRPELCFEPIKAGDNLYWHHLIRSGEMPVVLDNPRARASHRSHHHFSVKAAEVGVARGSEFGQMQGQGRRISVSRGIIAGR